MYFTEFCFTRSDQEAEVMAEILNEVGDDAVDEGVVREVSKLVKESADSVSPALVDTLGTLMEPLTTQVDIEELELLKEMTGEIQRDPSMTSLNKVSQILKEEGSDLTMQDIMIVNDIVNVMGPKVTDNALQIISVISKKAGNAKGKTE